MGRWGGTNYDEGTNMENSATTPTQGDTPGKLGNWEWCVKSKVLNIKFPSLSDLCILFRLSSYLNILSVMSWKRQNIDIEIICGFCSVIFLYHQKFTDI